MRISVADYMGDYMSSEHYALLDPDLKEYAEIVLSSALADLTFDDRDGLGTIDEQMLEKQLMNRVAPLAVPVEVKRTSPQLLEAFFEYLGDSGRCPGAQEWALSMPVVGQHFATRLREDGSVRGETARRNLPAVGRNEPCPCGSGKKFKKCCIDFFT